MTIAINDQDIKEEFIDKNPENHTTVQPEKSTAIDDLDSNEIFITSTDSSQQQRPSPKFAENKSPMCLINELTRHCGISHEYKLVEESGPPHQKVFKVVLRLGDREEFIGSHSSIRRAQHAAAQAALAGTSFHLPPPTLSKKEGKDPSKAKNTPTAELNVLAMKRGERVSYKVTEPRTLFPQNMSFNPRFLYDYRGTSHQRYRFPRTPYTATCTIGGKVFEGTGFTPQGAKHMAALEALKVMREELQDITTQDGKEVGKSPVSRVHEIAMKMSWNVKFDVVSSSGPTHLPCFVTRCTVSSHSVESEGTNKRFSKKKAAEKMLELLNSLPEVQALLQEPPPEDTENTLPTDPSSGKSRKRPAKVIQLRESLSSSSPSSSISEDDAVSISSGKSSPEVNPVSYLATYVSNRWKTKPKYHIIYVRCVNKKKKELVVECSVKGEQPLTAVGIDENEKIAKRKAAEAMMQLILTGKPPIEDVPLPDKSTVAPILKDSSKREDRDKKRRERKVSFSDTASGKGKRNHDNKNDARSYKNKKNHSKTLPPGVLRINIDKPVENGQAKEEENGAVIQTENSSEIQDAIAKSAASNLDIIGQLTAKLSEGKNELDSDSDLFQVLKRIVDEFGDDLLMHVNDFPKSNRSEFLTVITITTDPPIICHGSGSDPTLSRIQAALEVQKYILSLGNSSSTPVSDGSFSLEDENSTTSDAVISENNPNSV